MEEQDKNLKADEKKDQQALGAKEVFQGVSGRMITGIVQVVKKARKVEKAPEEAAAEAPKAAPTAAAPAAPTPATTAAAAATPAVPAPKAAAPVTKAPAKRATKAAEKTEAPAAPAPAPAKKAVEAAKVAPAAAVEQAPASAPAAPTKSVKAEAKAPETASPAPQPTATTAAPKAAEAPKATAATAPAAAPARQAKTPAAAETRPQERVIRDEPLTGRVITDQGVQSSAADRVVYRPQKGNYVGGNAQAPSHSYQRPQSGQGAQGRPRGPQSGQYRQGGGAYHAGGSSFGAPRRDGQGQGGGRPRNNDFRGGGMSGDKDRDEAPRQTRSPRQKSKSSFEPVPTELSNKKSDSRKVFAQRNNAKDKNRRDESFEGRQRRPDVDHYFDDEAVGRGRGRRKGGHSVQQEAPKPQVLTNVKLPSSMTVKELAEFLKKTSAEVIMKLMNYGIMATVNNEIDYDTAEVVANDFGIKAEQLVEITAEDILFDDSEDDVEKLVPRPPVVVVMGHVDHGKTSILDYIRNAHVAKGEAGGITQHIGAYTVSLDGRPITFLDTPGHEAFTAMRARGASVTDIAILVVAADDGVMPQTEEAIHHARAAGTEIIVAINKIDKPGVNLDRVKQELAKHNLMGEDWGGTTTIVPVSAKTGQGMDELLEMVLLTADMLELKADPTRQAKGTVIEARLDKARGPIATILVQRGTLRQGDSVVVGSIVGKIRAMTSDRGKPLSEAGPSIPVEILGLPAVPEGGDVLYQVENEKLAHSFAEKKAKEEHERQLKKSAGSLSLENLFEKMKEGETKDLNLIVKADVQGSVEAVTGSLEKLSNDEVKVKVIHGAVGAITGSDVRLAEVSNAIIIGFNVRPAANVSTMAEEAKVDIRLYRVIYNAIEDVENAMKGMLAPTIKEFILGHAEVRETYKVSGVGTIAGCYVTDGKIQRNASVRIVRDGIVIHEGKLASLKRFKDDAREVNQGYECGIGIEKFNDVKVGDQFEMYENREVERE